MPSKPELPVHRELLPGQVFAERYKTLELLGSGSDSTVYKVKDITADSIVALKLIRQAAMRQTRAAAQYKREINLLRKFSQRTCLRVLDIGEYLGCVYVSMEFVDGVTLRDYLRDRPKLPLDRFFNFFEQLCTALTQFHAHGVIHRDIHPGNIMITSDGTLKLMDFGVGRDLRHDPARPPGHGIEYAAPEQFAGGPFTLATDIYAVGAVCYEMLTDRRLHTQRSKRDRFRSTRPPFSSAELSGVPVALASVIERCLKTDPAKRFQEVNALRLGGLSAREPVQVQSGAIRLEYLMPDTPGNPDELVPLFLNLVRRLREVHSAGLFHHELSPKNIRVNGESVELDTFPPPPANATLLIADAKYTAPELFVSQTVLDNAGHIRSDIYVLGLLFYELLAGRSEMERQIAGIPELRTELGWMRWHADPAQKLRPVASVSPQCPRPLADTIERMFDKDPSRRPGTFEEVEENIASVRTRLARTQEFKMNPHPAQPKRRSRTGVIAAISAGALVVLLGAGWWLASSGWGETTSRISFWAARVRQAVGAGSQVAAPTSAPRTSNSPILNTPEGYMILIPEGEFLMGSDSVPDEAPAHAVSLPAFYIDRVEVSNRHYRDFCARTRRSLPVPPTWDRDYFQHDEYPAINVNKEDGRDFCDFAGKRLPSEAEWEKAARGTENPSIVLGNWRMPGLANLRGGSPGRPAPVGSFPADVSPFGVLDMAGNVQEWVADSWEPYPNNNKSNSNKSNHSPRLMQVRGSSEGKLRPPSGKPLPSLALLAHHRCRSTAIIFGGFPLCRRRGIRQ